MQRMIITDITFGGFKPIGNVVPELVQIMNEKFLKAKINVAMNHRGDIIQFKMVDGETKMFTSSAKNKVMLEKGDERIKKMGRNYLNTDRLTKEQEDTMWDECINGTLTSLGIHAKIKLYEHFDEDENSFLLLRDGVEYKPWPLKQKAYPIAAE